MKSKKRLIIKSANGAELSELSSLRKRTLSFSTRACVEKLFKKRDSQKQVNSFKIASAIDLAFWHSAWRH